MSILHNKNINISQILRWSSLPMPETEVLLAFLLNKSREFILAHPETEIKPAVYNKFKIFEKKRLANWPIAYLTRHKEFYGLGFKVSPAVLTPRPETELMVEEILIAIKNDQRLLSIVDLGTGSGAIVIALASELRHLSSAYFRTAEFSAVDISAPALSVARQNAQTHNLNSKINFRRGNLLAPLRLNRSKLSGRALIIAANLPYLTPAQIKQAPSIKREPRLALNGGSDGLKYYCQLLKQLFDLKLQNVHCRVFCEIDPSQSRKLSQLVKKIFPAAAVEIKKDLAGKNRLLIITLP